MSHKPASAFAGCPRAHVAGCNLATSSHLLTSSHTIDAPPLPPLYDAVSLCRGWCNGDIEAVLAQPGDRGGEEGMKRNTVNKQRCTISISKVVPGVRSIDKVTETVLLDGASSSTPNEDGTNLDASFTSTAFLPGLGGGDCQPAILSGADAVVPLQTWEAKTISESDRAAGNSLPTLKRRCSWTGVVVGWRHC